MPLAKDVNLAALTARTRGYSGADIQAISQKAGLVALHESPNAKEVSMKHFLEALQNTAPSVTPQMEAQYESLGRQLSGTQDEPVQKKEPFGFARAVQGKRTSE
jgi:transitional endoplasmic reticulum ATPase